ncbi:MAG: plasma-membrane proton-efflux P-type ATPase [Thermoplasmata archaeon]
MSGAPKEGPTPPHGTTPAEKGNRWNRLSFAEATAALGVDPDRGLSAEEVTLRRARSGFNEVADRPTPPVLRFLRQFWGPTAWMLELTAVLAGALGNTVDAVIIVLLLLFNATLGFTQDWRAGRALALLRQRLEVRARVLRGGAWGAVPARELVPGDIVRLRAGDMAPADVKLGTGRMEADESALTGESATVEKGPSDLVLSGSILRRGEGTGVVVLTGPSTTFGRTVTLVRSAHPRFHVTEVTNRLVRWLLAIVGVFLALGFAVAAVERIPLLPLLPLMLVLLISAIPVALPAMFTVATALGSIELVRQGVLVTRLNASEDAASMDLLLTDKTGTLTQNRAEIVTAEPRAGFSPEEVLRLGAMASSEADEDPLDQAFLEAARRAPGPPLPPADRFVPFDPATRRTEAVFGTGADRLTVAKGSPGTLAELAGLPEPERQAVEDRVAALAGRGLRSLAVARRKGDGPWELVGWAGIQDPPRPDARALIEELRGQGVGVKMLTGDSQAVARHVAGEVGLGSRILDGEEFRRTVPRGLPEAGLAAERADGFSRVFPEDKYGIVRALQSRGHLVGMTGDGVNDAPALAQAEVGIAVSSATDVAKASASAVLTAPGLEPMVRMVRIGREIHQRVVTWVLSKIVKTFQIAVFVVVAFLLLGRFVVDTFDVVLLLLTVDFVTIALATDTVRGSDRPASWRMGPLFRTGAVVGTLVLVQSLGLLGLLEDVAPAAMAASSTLTTVGFEVLFYFGIFTVLSVRSERPFFVRRPGRELLLACIADLAAITVLVTVGIPYLAAVPLPVTLLVVAWVAVFALGVNDLVKVWLLRERRAGTPPGTMH